MNLIIFCIPIDISSTKSFTRNRFFDKYNFCEPTIVDLNTFSAKWGFEFTEREDDVYVVIGDTQRMEVVGGDGEEE